MKQLVAGQFNSEQEYEKVKRKQRKDQANKRDKMRNTRTVDRTLGLTMDGCKYDMWGV